MSLKTNLLKYQIISIIKTMLNRQSVGHYKVMTQGRWLLNMVTIFWLHLFFYHWDLETVTSYSKLLLNRGGHMIMFDNIPVDVLWSLTKNIITQIKFQYMHLNERHPWLLLYCCWIYTLIQSQSIKTKVNKFGVMYP